MQFKFTRAKYQARADLWSARGGTNDEDWKRENKKKSERDKPIERRLEIGYFPVGPRLRDVFIKFLQVPQASNRQNIASPKLDKSVYIADFTRICK